MMTKHPMRAEFHDQGADHHPNKLQMKPQHPSAADRAAKILRSEIFALPEGSHLGLEGDLAARLGVSRPTFRQTARMLLQEQLLVVRRGVGGGYFTARPDAAVLNQLASAFLALSRADPFDLHAALQGLFREVARAAAQNDSVALRAELAEALETLRETSEASIPAGLAAATEVTTLFLQMAENAVISLFARVIYTFGGSQSITNLYRKRPDRLAISRESYLALGEAILAGDVALAMALAEKGAAYIEQWMREDMA